VVEQSQGNPVLKLGPNPKGQVIYFFGAKHTNDPSDEQFVRIKDLFEGFLNCAKGAKVVFVEGVVREIPQIYEEAINQYGESGAVQWLGMEACIDVIHPEPSDAEQREKLCASFNSSDVAYAVIVQNLASWFRHESQTSFNEAIDRVLNRESKFSSIYNFIPDRSWFNSQHKKLFGEQKLEDKKFLDLISNPRKSNTVINKVIGSRSKLRNKHILSVITKAWKSWNSIFIVYGKGHLVALEDTLKALVKN